MSQNYDFGGARAMMPASMGLLEGPPQPVPSGGSITAISYFPFSLYARGSRLIKYILNFNLSKISIDVRLKTIGVPNEGVPGQRGFFDGQAFGPRGQDLREGYIIN